MNVWHMPTLYLRRAMVIGLCLDADYYSHPSPIAHNMLTAASHAASLITPFLARIPRMLPRTILTTHLAPRILPLP